MFLNAVKNRNNKLIEAAIAFHQQGLISPDTYLLDVDTILDNAKKIYEAAQKKGIKLYAMTKQIGRNPFLAKKFIDIGYSGIVAVDFKEAEVMMKHNIKLGNVGHLVQLPTSSIEKVLKYGTEFITVYSVEKAEEIDRIAHQLDKVQKIMLRVLDRKSVVYSGQNGGFYLETLKETIEKISQFKNIKIAGLTSFPCFLYNKEKNIVEPTSNINTILEAKKVADDMGLEIEELNMPSVTSLANIDTIAKYGGTHGEPGHSLTGTTPYNAYNNDGEVPAIVYLSEVSHNIDGKGYFYGGGHYRRSCIEGVLVGNNIKNLERYKVTPPSDESIDYYFELEKEANIGATVVGAFRTQIFVTRSDVALIGGLSKNKPYIMGIYDSLGREK